MKRPKKWQQLPWPLWEYLLEDVRLDYCPYEGSRAEAVEQLLYGPVNGTNEARVAEYYSGVDDKLFESWVDKAITKLETGSKQIMQLLEGGQ